MAYTNHLLFNNVFLKNLKPSEEELASANYLVHESARDWYKNADFSSPQSLVNTWIRPLLNQQTLDLVEIESKVSTAWFLVAPWEREKPLGICFVVADRQPLDGLAPDGSLPKGRHWMIQAVNLALNNPDLNLRWVIVTNGDQWRLLDAKNLRRYEAILEIDLVDLLNGKDDWLAAYLFHRIVRLEESFERNDSDLDNKLDTFLELSIKATEATEKYLKTSVSDNLNTPGGGDGIMAQLCMGLVHAIDPSGEKAFDESERDEIYRNATYLLYRLLFILYAEARNLLPMNREDYQAISLNRLVDEAYAIHLNPGRDILHQTNLWDHLNSLFNAIKESDEYIGIPQYNGGLFENEDKPYLDKYNISNRFLSEALIELAFLLDEKGEKEPERIDYRDLSVRHLGSLYEGMIEYRLFIAEEELLARRDKDGKVKYLSAAKNEQKTNDEILQKGKVYFAQSPHERKATGTHYTAEDLVERLVKQTVMRLLDERWQEFEPQLIKWLSEVDATPGDNERQRLQSRVDYELNHFVESQVLSSTACDPAMGSGHFLVHIAHQMTNYILWILSKTPWENKEINLIADSWRKRIVENCLYGVDINQMAVELAKLSLWLATMQIGQPLSFLDHHLKQGNSLLGASLDEIESLLNQDEINKTTAKSAVVEAKGQYLLSYTTLHLQQKMGEANNLLKKIASQIVSHAEDIYQQETDFEEIEKILTPYKKIGDLIIAKKMGLKNSLIDMQNLAKAYEKGKELSGDQKITQEKAKNQLSNMIPFHWSLEFLNIFWLNSKKGFDVVVGNPPFLGGSKISSEIGSQFLEFIKDRFITSKGRTDLCAYFYLIGFDIINPSGCCGLLATNTISQGDTRESGLASIISNNGEIYYAEKNVKWKGDANLEVNLVAFFKESRKNLVTKYLDNKVVPTISSWLDDFPEIQPLRLLENAGKTFEGDKLDGLGFTLSKQEGSTFLLKDPKNTEVLFPYLIGKDLNENPDFFPNRYAICFHDWPIEKAKLYKDLFKIVENEVKPERQKLREKRTRNNWWLYGRYRKEMRFATENLTRTLVRSKVSEHHMLAFIPKNFILASRLAVFAFDDYFHFSVLQSNIHEIWLKRQASTLESRICYTTTDCFDTFPFPKNLLGVKKTFAEKAGREFYEFRGFVLSENNLGLTNLYNLLNNPEIQDAEINKLRQLLIKMDLSVTECYSWDDIEMQHDFYPNDRKKIRFMPSPTAQREIFTRLMALNQEIAAQEDTHRFAFDKEKDNGEPKDDIA